VEHMHILFLDVELDLGFERTGFGISHLYLAIEISYNLAVFIISLKIILESKLLFSWCTDEVHAFAKSNLELSSNLLLGQSSSLDLLNPLLFSLLKILIGGSLEFLINIFLFGFNFSLHLFC